MKRYTVKEVAKLSGVSVRALHFYDEIGLVKPAAIGENGYRYYGKEELLLLQQVLFYRELEFPLQEIQKLLSRPEFDKLAALREHKSMLERRATRLEGLIHTIEKTIHDLEGGKPMKDKELYEGFSAAKQKEYEKILVDKFGDTAKKHIAESKQRTKGWKKEDYERVKGEIDVCQRELTALLVKGAKPGDADVQSIMARHYRWVSQFWTPSRESYVGLGTLYIENPDFRKMYDTYHPRLAEFLAEAMRVYADGAL